MRNRTHERSYRECPGCGLVLMDRVGVRSTNIVAIGWEASEEGSTQGTLEVEFKQGIVYQYSEVPESVYKEFIFARSPGRFLKDEIVDIYEGQRIE